MMQRCMLVSRKVFEVSYVFKEFLALSRVWLKEAETPESNIGVETWRKGGIIPIIWTSNRVLWDTFLAANIEFVFEMDTPGVIY